MDLSSASLINSDTSGDTLFNVSPGDVNLGIGAPDSTILSIGIELQRQANQSLFKTPADSHSWLQYGPARGSNRFLRILSTWLTTHYPGNVPVEFENLFLTSGATSGLSLTCTLFGFSMGGLVFMEDPVYFIAGKVFDDHKMTKVAVRTDAGGIDLDDLETQMKARLPAERRPGQDHSALIYVVPTFNNPTGVTLPVERRKRLADLAVQYNALVICDDVYDLLSYTADPLPPRLVSYDQQRGHIISNGSFSKILGPGVRLGWIEASRNVVNRFAQSGIAASGGSLNHLTSGVVGNMISLGYQDALLKSVKETYSTKLQSVVAALQSEMSPSVTFTPPKGGFFIWVRLPEHVSAVELLQICKQEEKIGFQPGNWSSITGNFKNYIRLSFSFYDKDTLVWAVKRIAFHLKKLL